MLFCPLKLYVCINSAPRFVLPTFGYVIGKSGNSKFSASLVNSISPCVGLGLSISCKRLYSCRAVHKHRSRRDTSHVQESCEGIKSDLTEEANSAANVRTDGVQHNLGNVGSEDSKGTNKTSHGNKGRVPWNKGRKHSDETREKIRRRTKEALKDPKIRKKMSEAPRVLSNQTKVKIRASLRKLWRRRLKLKRSREKFLQSWGESIALAAKIGGTDQQELEWDSYEKFKQEVVLQNAERAKMKKLARKQKERAAQVKAERMARFAQKRREREENAKVRGESRKRNKKSKEEKEKLVESQEEKLKERLMKIHKKKSTVSHVSNQLQHRRPWEKFDLDLAKGSQLQKDISLADQIRFAKKRRAKLLVDKLRDSRETSTIIENR